MRKNHDEQIAQLVGNLPKPPKYTKEQKAVLKALKHLAIARYETKIDNGDFEYARGLLESLVIQDD